MENWEWLTAARSCTTKACTLLGLLVTPSAIDAICTVYNGKSTSSPVVLNVYLATKDTKNFDFGDGLKLNRGLFVGSFTNITGVLARWKV